MKYLLPLLLTISLTGCLTSMPVSRKFPETPAELKVPCPTELKMIDVNTTKLSEVEKVIVTNYGIYHECRTTVDDWITWYNTQKAIFESVK
jgi:hypothetical protein